MPCFLILFLYKNFILKQQSAVTCTVSQGFDASVIQETTTVKNNFFYAGFLCALSQGFTQVGKDFPVFLHPKTQEEYALARTERKSGKGYTGFVCDASSSVTLEEDLLRRDLTVNAIAQDNLGNLIDPYGGKKDLENRLLRHVS